MRRPPRASKQERIARSSHRARIPETCKPTIFTFIKTTQAQHKKLHNLRFMVESHGFIYPWVDKRQPNTTRLMRLDYLKAIAACSAPSQDQSSDCQLYFIGFDPHQKEEYAIVGACALSKSSQGFKVRHREFSPATSELSVDGFFYTPAIAPRWLHSTYIVEQVMAFYFEQAQAITQSLGKETTYAAIVPDDSEATKLTTDYGFHANNPSKISYKVPDGKRDRINSNILLKTFSQKP